MTCEPQPKFAMLHEMQHLFKRDNDGLLAQLAWARALLAFDFDGTLAPIVAKREAAALRSRTARLLEDVCGLYPCAVLSGRKHADLAKRIGRARVERLVSNLGFDAGRFDAAIVAEIAAIKPRLSSELSTLSGLEIEDKQHSLALHYRRCRSRRVARAAIARATAGLSPMFRVIPGKLVINIVHVRAPTKANALLRLRDEMNADIALYVGDDTSDEDVFQLDQPGRLLCVRVGKSATSRAAYYIHDQSEIDRLLHMLVELRGVRSRAISS